MTTPSSKYNSYKFSKHPTADIVSLLIILIIIAAEAVFIYTTFYFVDTFVLFVCLVVSIPLVVFSVMSISYKFYKKKTN